MITSNVLQRTFFVRFGEGEGTCFAIDVDNRQYFVTAKHVVEGIKDADGIHVFHEGQWKELGVRVVGHGRGNTDITVLSPSHKLIWGTRLVPTMQGIVLGQDVYFLGFPYGLKYEAGDLNRGFPMPFIKKGVVSSFGDARERHHLFYLDAHNNPGFSGGPVVFQELGQVGSMGQKAREWKVAGMVSAYRFEPEPILYRGAETSLVYRANTGIVICYSIEQVLEMIRAHPIGLEL